MLKILAGEENFSDAEILGANAREQQEMVQGIWIYELAELEGLNKSDVTHVKLFASKTHDKARRAYARARSDQPRRCVFVATTNDQTYLRDRTGNRRFWPVEVGVIDLEAVGRDRDQLWAEAVEIERGGEPLVIGQELWSDVEAKQRAKTEVDPWENIIVGELAKLMRMTENGMTVNGFAKAVDIDGNAEWRISSDYLLGEVLEVPKERQHNNHAKRLAAVMRDLDWHHPEQALRIGKLVKRGFVKPSMDQI
jgi:predicted P-loop ATPase